jgi:3'-5' exoribonuclease
MHLVPDTFPRFFGGLRLGMTLSERIMKDLTIAGLSKFENQVVLGHFSASSKQVRSKKDGSKYLALVLGDCTGQIEARLWDANEAGEFEQGDIVKVRGQVSRYQDKLQITLDRIRKSLPEEYDLGDFVPQTERNIDELWAELNGFVDSLADPDFKALLRAFFDDEELAAALRQAPAAKSMHHAWIGGLLEHIVSLVGISSVAAQHYPEINRDLLLTGAMLHDIGKLEELRWGTSFEYTLEGQLLGHITIGIGMIERKIATLPNFPAAKRLLIEHVVLSHHGKYEFGSPKLPMVPEAILLHYLDDMDAKMQTVRSEFARSVANGKTAGQMTDWVRAMERPLLDTQAYLETQKLEAPETEMPTAQSQLTLEMIEDAIPGKD